ncbi:MAG: UbiA family prenyltransferase [Planctomycetes bacterium]|nr:UbiA family prenyltransferase [Planctomycetota bacterium]
MAWLRLLRITLAPTILWDVAAGAWLVHGASPLNPSWGFTLLACLCVYHAGMVFNDVADRDLDAKFRPQRPIPSNQIRTSTATLAGIALFCVAWLAATPLNSEQTTLIRALMLIVLLYNFSGSLLRSSIGPALLAAARASSFTLGALCFTSAREFIGGPYVWVAAGYALFFLFLSRLAQEEEKGCTGMRGLSRILAASCAPWMILAPAFSVAGAVSVMTLQVFLVRPAWQARHQFWSPKDVQSHIRRGLSHAPFVTSCGLVAHGYGLFALAGVGIFFSVSQLAKRLPPE